MSDASEQGTPRRVRRRRVLTHAAWTTPVMAVSFAAPAVAASRCSISVPPPSTANGWTTVLSPTNGLGASGTGAFATNGFSLTKDPTTRNQVLLTASSPPIAFTSGQAIRFTYNFTKFSANARKLTFEVLVGGVVVPGSLIDSDVGANTGSRSVVYTPSTTGNATIQFRFTFPGGATSNVGDDITVTNFAAACVNP